MATVLNISEAASLALHTMVLLAARPGEMVSTRQAAGVLDASEAHLSKVLQRLHRAGLVKSVRGPGGGFALEQAPERVTLLAIYEAFEGPIDTHRCLYRTALCGGEKCIFGSLLSGVSQQVRDYLARTRLPDVIDVMENVQ